MGPLDKRSLWKPKSAEAWKFFCPNCRAERRLAGSPRPGNLRHFIQIGLLAVVVTLVFWPLFSWKGIVSFVPLWGIFEMYYRSRVRVALSCPYCGFDPYLYLVDVKRAREEIENHWRKKFSEKGIPFPEKDDPLVIAARKAMHKAQERDENQNPP